MATTPVATPFTSTPGAIPFTGMRRTPPTTALLPPIIPHISMVEAEEWDPQVDYAEAWDHDTDTLASFLAWKTEFETTRSANQTATALMTPICEFVRKEVQYQLSKHSVTVKIPGLQEMKERELETQKHILSLTETINKLSEQVATLSKRPATTIATAAPSRATVATTTIHRAPTTTPKPAQTATRTYAQVAEKEHKEFTEVKSKKKARKETILPKPYPTADRLVIFSLTSAPNDRKKAADTALQVINKTITDHSDITYPPFILANVTATNNLVFTVAPQHLGTDYEPYLAIFEDALHEFPIASSRVSRRWTRFIIHGIPTTASPETARTEIETTYPSLQMGQTPRWLTSPERRQGKEASSMVVTFVGEMTKKSLGATSLALFNRECNIAEYISFGPSTQCNKCQQFGHPTQRCTASDHVCAVCAQQHPTRNHPCAIGNCKAGHSCSHPPIRCANCQQPHKASDRNCPTYVKIMMALRRDNAVPADATMTV
jgi:hypothetical protein